MKTNRKWLWLVPLLAICLPVIVRAQSPVICMGQDQNGNLQRIQVDTGGNLSLTSASSTNTKGSTATNLPAAVVTVLPSNGAGCTAVGGASCTIAYGPTDWSGWPNLTITIFNTGANAITNVIVEWSPDNSHFEAWDTTTFAALAAGATKSMALSGNSRRYLRVEMQSASGTSSANVQITANQN